MIKYTARDYIQMYRHTALGVDLITWLRILSTYRFRIGVFFIPKVLFITGMAILNLPFQLFEYFLYKRKVKAVKVKQPIFILGHPRSGTTFLFYLLSRDQRFGYCNVTNALTPNLMFTAEGALRKLLDRALPDTRPQDNVKVSSGKPKEEEFAMANLGIASIICGFYFPKKLRETFDRFALFTKNKSDKTTWQRDFYYVTQKLTLKKGGKQLILKSPYNTARLKEILEIFPDALFIHIHRDPYTVYNSTVKLFEKVLPILSLHKVDQEHIHDYVMYSYRQMHEKFLKDKKALPESRLVEFGYDEFTRDPIDKLRTVYQRLGISGFEDAKMHIQDELNSFENYQTNKYADITEETRAEINREWAFFFDAYNYPINSA